MITVKLLKTIRLTMFTVIESSPLVVLTINKSLFIIERLIVKEIPNG